MSSVLQMVSKNTKHSTGQLIKVDDGLPQQQFESRNKENHMLDLNIKERLMSIVTEILEVERDQVEGNEGENLFKKLNVDSLLALEIVASVEREFNIMIDDEEVDSLITFNNLVEVIQRNLQKR